MSDDLIALADARLARDTRISTHWDGCEASHGHDVCLIAKLAAALREQDAMLTRNEGRVKAIVDEQLLARAERAGAERDALAARLKEAEGLLKHQRTALQIVRDRQGGKASVDDINKGIALIDAFLAGGKT